MVDASSSASEGVAVVTGGGRGIGAAIVEVLARQGFVVAIAEIGSRGADTAARLSDEGLNVRAYAMDVADRSSVADAAELIRAELGTVSVVVNNAGIAGWTPLDDDEALGLWDKTIAVNLTGTFNVSREFLPDLRATKGNIINIASVVAFTSGFAAASYIASKGGVRSLTSKLARELAPDGIRVNAIAPGYVATDIHSTATTDEFIQFHCPMGRWGLASEIAAPVGFLVSPAASYITGVTLPVDGGFLTV